MGSPFLSNIGVHPHDQARAPTAEGFPSGLNQNNAPEWAQAVQSYRKVKTVLGNWASCLREYVDLCGKRGLFPFANTGEGRNSHIEDLLLKARQDFVRFVNKFKFFEAIHIRSTHREAVATDQGFVLTVYAKARIEDPSFVQWLERLPQPYTWSRVHESRNRYHKDLSPNLCIWVENETYDMPERWHVGYDINIPVFPAIPNNPMPSRKEIEEFALEVLWMPLIRSMRPISMDHRLI
jgi:hypothetical protein